MDKKPTTDNTDALELGSDSHREALSTPTSEQPPEANRASGHGGSGNFSPRDSSLQARRKARELHAKIVVIANRIIRNKQFVDAVVSEATRRALNVQSELDMMGNPDAFLRKIVRNEYLRVIQQELSVQAHREEADIESIESTTDCPAQLVEFVEELCWLLSSMESERDRKVFTLIAQGHTEAETAETLNLTHGKVRASLVRAQKVAQKKLRRGSLTTVLLGNALDWSSPKKLTPTTAGFAATIAVVLYVLYTPLMGMLPWRRHNPVDTHSAAVMATGSVSEHSERRASPENDPQSFDTTQEAAMLQAEESSSSDLSNSTDAENRSESAEQRIVRAWFEFARMGPFRAEPAGAAAMSSSGQTGSAPPLILSDDAGHIQVRQQFHDVQISLPATQQVDARGDRPYQYRLDLPLSIQETGRYVNCPHLQVAFWCDGAHVGRDVFMWCSNAFRCRETETERTIWERSPGMLYVGKLFGHLVMAGNTYQPKGSPRFSWAIAPNGIECAPFTPYTWFNIDAARVARTICSSFPHVRACQLRPFGTLTVTPIEANRALVVDIDFAESTVDFPVWILDGEISIPAGGMEGPLEDYVTYRRRELRCFGAPCTVRLIQPLFMFLHESPLVLFSPKLATTGTRGHERTVLQESSANGSWACRGSTLTTSAPAWAIE